MKVILLLVAVMVLCLGEEIKRFDNFKVYQVVPTTHAHLEALRQLERNIDYNFWSGAVLNSNVDIMVSPHRKYDFQNLLHSLNLPGRVLIEDVQDLINNERNRTVTDDFFTYYQPLEKIHDWLRSLESIYPKFVKLVVGGKTHERREILGVHVSFKKGNKAVFLEGGIHAREWIAPATVNYILNQLLTSTDPAVRAVAESRDWYVFPIVNPDGYVYSHTVDRLWRKTRKPYYTTDGVECYGADPNRNWDYHWMEGGASNFPCDETFGGDEAFSEIEAKSLSDYINTIALHLDVYLAFHAYGQLLLVPFGHNGSKVPKNNDEMLKIGRKAMDKLAERHRTKYRVGNIPETVYVASGLSTDWIAGTHRHVRLVYSFELRGKYSFVLPTNEIIPTGEETLDAVISMIQQIDGSA